MIAERNPVTEVLRRKKEDAKHAMRDPYQISRKCRAPRSRINHASMMKLAKLWPRAKSCPR
jgi:hypothetical protein